MPKTENLLLHFHTSFYEMRQTPLNCLTYESVCVSECLWIWRIMCGVFFLLLLLYIKCFVVFRFECESIDYELNCCRTASIFRMLVFSISNKQYKEYNKQARQKVKYKTAK